MINKLIIDWSIGTSTPPHSMEWYFAFNIWYFCTFVFEFCILVLAVRYFVDKPACLIVLLLLYKQINLRWRCLILWYIWQFLLRIPLKHVFPFPISVPRYVATVPKTSCFQAGTCLLLNAHSSLYPFRNIRPGLILISSCLSSDLRIVRKHGFRRQQCRRPLSKYAMWPSGGLPCLQVGK